MPPPPGPSLNTRRGPAAKLIGGVDGRSRPTTHPDGVGLDRDEIGHPDVDGLARRPLGDRDGISARLVLM
jgi:hypothetical protein